MEILLWWLPPAIVTGVAIAWVSWLARAQEAGPDRSEAAQERFAAAILREHPAMVSNPRPVQARVQPSTGIAVRPSRAGRVSSDEAATGSEGDSTRRTA